MSQTELTDEQILRKAEECGLYVIGRYCDGETFTNNTGLAVIALVRSLVSSLVLEREEAGGETSDSVHLAVPTNGPESHGGAR